ncbi:uncharacterized protein LOC129001491 [Macrosteles quadrilineatus]|uniref:uncharacterized protein LOC129001491 n=1 Tax=Macrosteles quadrilineatus TaxID=74068 RepID=UPI0023E0D2C3|nr:uncharacterized protein LOC129001491 [Macrosteles quadrilineatus]
MKQVFTIGALLICFTMIMADPENNEHLVGGLTLIDETENIADVEEGRKLLMKHLEAKFDTDREACVVKVSLPDLKIYQQVVAGVMYHYVWAQENYTSTCKDGSMSIDGGDKQKVETMSKKVDCKAKYFVQSWTNTKKLFTPEC